MRVVCIDDNRQSIPGIPIKSFLTNGNVYTVIDSETATGPLCVINGVTYRSLPGVYYYLAETTSEFGFHESLFVVINENQQDETEMEREYSKDKVVNK